MHHSRQLQKQPILPGIFGVGGSKVFDVFLSTHHWVVLFELYFSSLTDMEGLAPGGKQFVLGFESVCVTRITCNTLFRFT